MPTLLIAASLALAFPAQGDEQQPPPPALPLLDPEQLSAELAAIAAAHPGLVELHKLGDSRAGRAIEALRFAGKGARDERGRPAILLVANLDGARVYSSAVALQHARALAEGYAGDPKVQALLDS